MHTSTKKWLFLKCSSLILIPLMVWFTINLVSIYQADHKEVINFFTHQPSKILFSLFIVFAYFFSALTISEIFEDYINEEKIKSHSKNEYKKLIKKLIQKAAFKHFMKIKENTQNLIILLRLN